MKAYAYARVSTRDQNLEPQLDQIKKYAEFRNIELVGVFQDKASGKDTNRDDFQRMMKTLEVNPQGVEAVVITKLDRIGRSLLNLIEITNWLQDNHIGLISITNSIDTTTKEGRLFFYIMGALGEYERELIMERTKVGRDLYLQKGGKLGQPPKNIPMDEINKLLLQGVPKSKIAKKYNIHRTTLYKKLAQLSTDDQKKPKLTGGNKNE